MHIIVDRVLFEKRMKLLVSYQELIYSLSYLECSIIEHIYICMCVCDRNGCTYKRSAQIRYCDCMGNEVYNYVAYRTPSILIMLVG